MKMKIAKRTFKFTDAYGSGEVVKGERVVADHELVAMFPDAWRNFTLDDELKVRSDRVAELATRDFTASSTQPLSRAGRAQREEDTFWRSVDQQIHRDERPAEERREDAFFDRALSQIEDLDAARVRDENIELGELWYGRIGG